MAGYLIRKTKEDRWEVVDRKSGQPIGLLRLTESGYCAESEQLKMQAEASDPWLILRMVFNTEDFHLDGSGHEPKRITADNVRDLMK